MVAGVLAALGCVLAGCNSVDASGVISGPIPTVPPGAVVQDGGALSALAEVEVKGRAPKTGYDRVADFGPAWEDTDHNGCDTRNDILARDLTVAVFKAGSSCVIASGILSDPYSGEVIDFVRGVGTSSKVQIDHVVALSDAWQKGAQGLEMRERVALANDPLNLLAVKGSLNESKGDGDAATWLPPRRAEWCPYVARQTAVKVKYHLWMTQAEHDRIKQILEGCATQPLPTVGSTGTSPDGK